MRFSNLFRRLAVAFLLVGVVFSSLPYQISFRQFPALNVKSAEAANNNGMVVYGEGTVTTPRYRTWNGTNFSAEGSATTGNATIQYVVMKESPARDEKIHGTLASDGDINFQVWAGSTWGYGTNAPAGGNYANLGTTNDAYRGFDIAYEQNSGLGLVVYEDSTTANQTVSYRTYNGTQWSNATSLSIPTGVNNTSNWIKLEAKPNSDDMMLVIQDSNLDIYAIRWNGSTDSWTNGQLLTAAGSVNTTDGFDVAWEGSSGDALVYYGSGTATDFWTFSGTTWTDGTGGALCTNTGTGAGCLTSGAAVHQVKLSSARNSDHIAMILIDAGADVTAQMWNGTTWLGVPSVQATWEESAAELPSTTTRSRTVENAWEEAGNRFMFVYIDNGFLGHSYFFFDVDDLGWKNADGTTALTDIELATKAANFAQDDIEVVHLDPNPNDDAQIMLTEVDLLSDSESLLWNGSSWTTPTQSLHEATVSVLNMDPVYFIWDRTPPPPDATSVTYTVSPDGGRSGDSITLTGVRFGTASAGNRANCAGGAGTGCVQFIVGGSATVTDGDVTAWSDTSITFTIDASLASNGGAAALQVVGASVSDPTPLTFYIYPRVTSIAITSGFSNNTSREYAAGDTHGVIMLSGDHFGTAAGTATILGSAATVHGTAEGPCTVAGWGSTGTGVTVCLEVPSAISDSLYTGAIVVTRNGDSKTHSYPPSNDFRILPRITANTPTSGGSGDVVQISGNHFCQTGTCPVSPNRSSASNNVLFGGTQALDSDFVNQSGGAGTCNGAGAAWAHGEICVKVPAAANGSPGLQPTQVTSNTYTSNQKDFTVLSSVPNAPTNLAQFKSNGTTPITTGAKTNESTVVLKADISGSLSINMAVQMEVKPTATAFDGTTNLYPASPAPTSPGGCSSCTALAAASSTVSGLTDGGYHWRARTKNTTTGEFSPWTDFNGGSEGFIVDTTGPTINFGTPDTCTNAASVGTNSATISWSLNESADGKVEYSINADMSGSAFTATNPANTSHVIPISNLNSGTTYYWRAISVDAVANSSTRPPSSPFCSFVTSAVTQPGKTTKLHITGQTGGLTVQTDFAFSLPMPETSPGIKSSFVEVSGIASGTGSPNNALTVQVLDQSPGTKQEASKTYELNASGTTATFRVLYPITASNLNPNDSPYTSQLRLTPRTNTTISVTSAKLVVTYAYTP